VQLGEAFLYSLDEDVEVGRGVAVSAEAEHDAPAVGEDRDAHSVSGGERDDRLKLAQWCAEGVQLRAGARHVGDRHIEESLRSRR